MAVSNPFLDVICRAATANTPEAGEPATTGTSEERNPTIQLVIAGPLGFPGGGEHLAAVENTCAAPPPLPLKGKLLAQSPRRIPSIRCRAISGIRPAAEPVRASPEAFAASAHREQQKHSACGSSSRSPHRRSWRIARPQSRPRVTHVTGFAGLEALLHCPVAEDRHGRRNLVEIPLNHPFQKIDPPFPPIIDANRHQ